ncbi:MAG: ATPase, T2SS/T4P/T4SS family, partial [Ruthenibacterium sp.]
RGAEALDMLQSMNLGQNGSMTTVHANVAAEAFDRLLVLASESDLNVAPTTIARQIASALDIVVHADLCEDGVRRIVEIAEVVGVDKDDREKVLATPLFLFQQTGVSDTGDVIGAHVGCDTVPTFFGDFAKSGRPIDPLIFKEGI